MECSKLLARKARVICGALVLLLAFNGCAADRTQTARNPETDALLLAARGGHADTVKSLLTAAKADVNGKDERGNTPLMEAARFGHDEVVRALLVARADARAKNSDGKTALKLAAEGGHTETVQLLKQAGAVE
jgi:ankyrin repeat protein